MADRPRHPHKEIEAVVAHAEEIGWRWRKMGHWGRLFCAHAGRDGCQVGVNGTPKNPEDHARQVMRAITRCPHGGEEDK
ncbi:hypothetical protein [Bradyrhizobium sp. SSUT77]|uniref:hypothetical protein n=1 Tax=Bradyrhizobium sp. SSUT77 TaxID=3040603 RepID=UPI00244B136A|nr:hypothetical protein [Bradyrhizobium sp. SSUT77]MDH2347257.1 hypothetical protein [Bradyrhizobium sp. SSUT77]